MLQKIKIKLKFIFSIWRALQVLDFNEDLELFEKYLFKYLNLATML